MDFRLIVWRRLEEKGMSAYQLSQRLEGKVSRSTLYRFLDWDGYSAIPKPYPQRQGRPPSGIGINVLSAIFDELELIVVPRETMK
jgi:hypothetical protein